MASVMAKDIPVEQQMWTDIWNWRKKYYYPEKSDAWWKSFIQEGVDIGEKYKTSLSKSIVFAVLDDVNKRREVVTD